MGHSFLRHYIDSNLHLENENKQMMWNIEALMLFRSISIFQEGHDLFVRFEYIHMDHDIMILTLVPEKKERKDMKSIKA